MSVPEAGDTHFNKNRVYGTAVYQTGSPMSGGDLAPGPRVIVAKWIYKREFINKKMLSVRLNNKINICFFFGFLPETTPDRDATHIIPT